MRPRFRLAMGLCAVAGAAVVTGLASAPAGRSAPEGDSTSALHAEGAPQVGAEPDSTSLMRDLFALAHDSMEGRATGTEGNARARAFLARRLTEAGAGPLGPSFEQPFEWGQGRTGVNLVGAVPGSEGATTIVLSAHFDHLGRRGDDIFNGADDDASGVVAVLEMLRLVAVRPLRSRLVVALFDAEEAGLRGARAFVRSPPFPLDSSVLNVNLDMVARTDGLLWASGASHTPSLRPILEAVAAGAPLTLRLGHDRPGAPEGDDWTGSSDHGPFHDAGIPFVYFGVEDHPDYHRPTDDAEAVDPAEFVASVRAIYAALRALDTAMPIR